MIAAPPPHRKAPRSPLRILYHFRNRGDGAEAVHIAGIAGAFRRLGHEVRFESPTGADPFANKGLISYRTRPGGVTGWLRGPASWCRGFVFEFLEIAYNPFAIYRLSRKLRAAPAELLYERHAFFLFATAWVATRRGLPLIIEINELVGDPRVRAQPFLAPFARWTARYSFFRASLLVVVSPHLRRRLLDLGLPSDKILVLPNAVDERDYASLPPAAATRRRHAFGEGELLIGFIGWFVPWHQLDRLIACFADLTSEFPGIRLVLVGEGELGADLRRLAVDLGVSDSVAFVDPVPHHEIPSLLAAMDVCVVPQSNAYRSPIKLFEYMAAGRAVVAPRTEPIAGVCDDGEEALLFDPGSAGSLTAALRRLLGDAALRETLGAAARERVLRDHTWSGNAARILDALA